MWPLRDLRGVVAYGGNLACGWRRAAAAGGERAVRRSVEAGPRPVHESAERRQQAIYTMVPEPEVRWGHVLVILGEPHLLERQDLARHLHPGLSAVAQPGWGWATTA